MLESMLWHLGMSPSEHPGGHNSVARLIGKDKEVFHTGTPSVGLMMGRFNYINYGNVGSRFDHMQTGKIADKESLDRLKQHWQHYQMAYDKNTKVPLAGKPKFTFDDVSAEDKAYAVSIFDGGNFEYSSEYQTLDDTFTIEASYTEPVHEAVSKYKAFERIDILKAMASKEAASFHWGSKGSYRMHVGGYDERGSKGFNQIYNSIVYGGSSAQGDKRTGAFCHQVSGYSLKNKSVANHYDPGENLKAKVIFMTAWKGDCGRSFRLAFHKNLYTATHNEAEKILRRIKMGPEDIAANTAHQDDRYEQLVKALGAYNQGWSLFNSETSWSELITDPKTITPDTETEANRRKAMLYGLDILKNTHKVNGVSSNHGIGLPLRTYIWEGKADQDLNGDGKIEYVVAKPNAVPPTPEYKEKGWCFAYGEEEWMSPFEVKDRSGKTKKATFRDYKTRAKSNLASYSIACE
jgi:hypothetical protein